MSNNNLNKAKKAKNDEFYTRYEDIEKELQHYKKYFENKVVYCNCDWPALSEFRFYFENNFKKLKLKKLIVTGLKKATEQNAYALIIDSNENKIVPIDSNGDFRSEPCVEFLKEADIVVTNPPFSCFREYVAQLIEYNKKFVIIGNKNAITYKKFFPLLKENKVWIGYTNVKEFLQPDGSVKKFGNIGWFTNLDIDKRHEELILWKNYNPDEYPKYDNYLAWNVNKVSEIPCDNCIDIEIDKSELELYRVIYPDLEVLSDD